MVVLGRRLDGFTRTLKGSTDYVVVPCSKSRSIIALRGPGQFIGEVLLFDNTGRDSPMGSWQTCVRARTQVQALILTVKDLKDLVTRKPAAEVELRAGEH